MAESNLLDAWAANFQQLGGSGRIYRVPRYPRDCSPVAKASLAVTEALQHRVPTGPDQHRVPARPDQRRAPARPDLRVR